MAWRQISSFAVFITIAVPVNAQVATMQTSARGQLSITSGGTIGQRQAMPPTALANVPGARVDVRINSRVQNRIRNRIDRYYDPQANALSPFLIAEGQIRSPGRH